jgi:predicted RNase H-like HicB family nuclease
MIRFPITLEQTKKGFSVQVPDLAIIIWGKNIAEAKFAASEAIQANLDTYQEIGKSLPTPKPVSFHLENPDFADSLFAYVDMIEESERIAA